MDLFWPQSPESTRVLYLAKYAPDYPVYQMKPEENLYGYSEYHFNVYRDLCQIGYSVFPSSKPYSIMMATGNVDFVFSLLNRMPINNPEILISSLGEYCGIPYMGAPPNVRALAEDKYFSKLAMQSLGIPVVPGAIYAGRGPLAAPSFPGPYFVKDRFGAASEGIYEDSLQDDWAGAMPIVRRMLSEGRQVLVEQYFAGIDVTVPVIGHSPYMILGHVSPNSDKVGHILTEDLKLDDHLGNSMVDVGDCADAMAQDIAALWAGVGPIDYFRLDYRWDPQTGRRVALEFNICCFIGAGGALCMAAAKWGFGRKDLLAHAVEYSLRRQAGTRTHCRWIP